MNIIKEDLIKLLLLALVAICSYLSSRWVLNAVYKSSGVTKEEVFSYRASVSRSKHAGRRLNNWIISRAENPATTRKYLNLYTFATASAALYGSITFIAVISDGEAISKIHIIAGIALLLFYSVLFFVGIRYKAKIGDCSSISDDAKEYVDFIKREADKECEERGSIKGKLIIGACAVLVFGMIFIAVAVPKWANPPIEATSYDTVWELCEDMNCLTYDKLEKYREDWKDNGEEKKLLKAMSADNSSIHIEFYEFIEESYAKNITSQFIDFFREKQGYDRDKEIIETYANFNIYVYSDDETVTKMYRVDNTLLILKYPKDKKPVADELLVNIGYKEK